MKTLMLIAAMFLASSTIEVQAQSGGAKEKAAAARSKVASKGGQSARRPEVSRPSQRPDVQRPANRPSVSRPEHNRPRPGHNGNRPGDNRPGDNRPGDNRPGNNRPGNNRPGNNRPGNNRPGNGGNNTIIINNNNTWNNNRVRGDRYYYPRGYRYHRHGIGHTLPRVFLTATYYYAAYAALGLIDPGPDYVWVRYGSDLYLVHRRTGYVRDVRYDVFEA
jgi:Ni/Co efflux regulator RcnB